MVCPEPLDPRVRSGSVGVSGLLKDDEADPERWRRLFVVVDGGKLLSTLLVGSWLWLELKLGLGPLGSKDARLL